MCKEEHAKKLAACFQIAHVWSWAWLKYNYGIFELSASGSWFSSVEIDKIMRKSADASVVTISQPFPKPNGKAYTISDLIEYF